MEPSFENIKYDSYYQNADFYDLPNEYELSLFKNLPMDCLADNIVETLNVSSIKISFDNIMYESNPQYDELSDLPSDGDQKLISGRKIFQVTFDGDQRFISGRQIYHVNENIVFRTNNSLIIDIYTNQM